MTWQQQWMQCLAIEKNATRKPIRLYQSANMEKSQIHLYSTVCRLRDPDTLVVIRMV